MGAVYLLSLGILKAQVANTVYSRLNTWEAFAEYSNDSSHIFMGYARERKLADAGIAYGRRFWQGRHSGLSYVAEFRPVLFESDPTETGNGLEISSSTNTSTTNLSSNSVTTIGKCIPSAGQFSYPDPGGGAPIVVNYSFSCGRRWTFGQSFTPAGLKYSLRTNHPVQPFAVLTAGYMYTNKPVPTEDAGSFNFMFDFGGGIEMYRSATHSVSMEARLHHFSNKNTAYSNPGTDSVHFKVSYNFGR